MIFASIIAVNIRAVTENRKKKWQRFVLYIRIWKENKKKCFCHQSQVFNYDKKQKVFVGKEGKRYSFELKKFVVYQMI